MYVMEFLDTLEKYLSQINLVSFKDLSPIYVRGWASTYKMREKDTIQSVTGTLIQL